MVTIAYLAYGRRRLTETAVFSALTFVHAASALDVPWRLVVYTDAPELFTRARVPCTLVPLESLRDDASLNGYGYRRKLLAIRHCAEHFDGDLFFVDGDTYFTASPARLFELVSPQCSVLHTLEWNLSDETQPTLNRAMRERQFRAPVLQAAQQHPELPMWNSGVVGLAAENKDAIEAVIAACDELYAATGYHAVEQFAWGLVLGERTRIVAADDVVHHYWYGREELTHRIVRFLRANRRLSGPELAARAYAFRPTATDGWVPPTEVRARRLAGATRRGVEHMIATARSAEFPPSALGRLVRPSYRFTTALVPARVELPLLLNQRGLTGRAAEIGVRLGAFSEHLLDQWNGRELISIDPWMSDDPRRYVDTANVAQDEQDDNYRTTLERLARFGDRSSVWRTTSADGARRVPDASLDFVYIDARHDYRSVLEDLEAWLPKLRAGGIIAGHDYVDGLHPEGEFGVKSAVDEFFGARDMRVYSTLQDTPWVSWLVDVPSGDRWQPPRALEVAARSGVVAIRRVRQLRA